MTTDIKIIRARRTQRILGLRGGRMCSDELRPPNPVAAPYNRLKKKLEIPTFINRPRPKYNPYTSGGGEKFFIPRRKPTPPKMPTELPPLVVRTICDVDQTFYSAIEGRPLKSQGDTKVYMANIRDIAMCRANIGFLNDRVICLKDARDTEKALLQNVVNLYYETRSNFSTFLETNHNIANGYQLVAKRAAEAVVEQTELYEEETYRFIDLRSIVSAMRVECELLHRYRKFFNKISPNWWRRLHDENYVEQLGVLEPLVLPTVSFARYDIETDDSDVLTMVLEPDFFFQDAHQLNDWYLYLQKQCLNYLENSRYMASILKSIFRKHEKTKSAFEDEITAMNDVISSLERIVISAEDLAKELKTSCEDLLKTKVMELTCSRDTIMLESYVEYAHEKLIGVTLGRREVVAMATAVQRCYMDLADELDVLDPSVVKVAEKKYFAEEAKALKLAYNARTELIQWKIMTQALHAAMAPPPPCPRGWRVMTKKNKSFSRRNFSKSRSIISN